MSPSIKVIPNSRLYVSEPDPRWFGNGPNPTNDPAWSDENWLKSRFHFSFAEYSNSANSKFGVVRVMNDDLVQPKRGFGTHPHNNMEILTYIVEGGLTHQDSTGNKETLGRGAVQFMTAGTGIRHSEYNHGDKPLRFIQTWIEPYAYGLAPNYGSGEGPAEERKNKLQHLASSVKDTAAVTPVKINQDVDAYASELELGQKVELNLPQGRQAYLLCIEGEVKVNGENQLVKYDGCEIVAAAAPAAAAESQDGGTMTTTTMTIEATNVEDTENGKLAHILLFTMKHVPGSGRKDL